MIQDIQFKVFCRIMQGCKSVVEVKTNTFKDALQPNVRSKTFKNGHSNFAQCLLA